MGNDKLTDGSLALQGRMPQIITIEASEHPRTAKLRVAAYIRVSSNSLDQEHSFAAQNSYYTSLVANTKEWTLVDIYADEGITGTSAEKRKDFNRLIADCRRGLIDRVLCKSISRFARNTKDCLETIRELKALGISICFEEQNIDTASMSSEMVVAFLASFAQTESTNISANLRWGIQKRMKMGTFVPSAQPFGYMRCGDEIQIDTPHAKYVCQIFALYLAGKNTREIADYLNQQGKADPALTGITWTCKKIARMLRNEKYIGDSLWQKSYHTATLPRKELKNRGEIDSYYAESTHPAIIEKDTYHRVQALLTYRNRYRKPTQESEESPFRNIIRCGYCGSPLRRKVINGQAYRVCRKHDTNSTACPLKPIPENEIELSFLRLYYNIKRFDIISQMLEDLKTIRERRLLWREDIIDLNKKISELSSQNLMLAELKKQGLIDPDIFIAQANELAQQLRAAKQEKERLLSSMADDSIERTKAIVEILSDGPDFLDAFDPDLFGDLIDQIIVEDNDHICFRLKNGLELPETIERTIR